MKSTNIPFTYHVNFQDFIKTAKPKFVYKLDIYVKISYKKRAGYSDFHQFTRFAMNLHNFSSNCLNTSRCLISLRDNLAMSRNLPNFPTISTHIGELLRQRFYPNKHNDI